MSARQPELHVSALSPAEYKAYTRYLDSSLSAQAAQGDAGIDPDGTARFERGVVRDFGAGRLDVPKPLVDDVLRSIPGRERLQAGQVYAVLRALAHAAGGRRPELDLVFVPAEPLPLDPASAPPPAPPRRAPAQTPEHKRRPSLPAKPKPPSPPRRSSNRRSLPANSDPFRDAPPPPPSPPGASGALPPKPEFEGGGVPSKNPFRSGTERNVFDDGKKPSPPSPARKPSIRPNLPPRTRQRASSTSSSSTLETSGRPPSGLIATSLAAARAAPVTEPGSSVTVSRRAKTTRESSSRYGDSSAASGEREKRPVKDSADEVQRAVSQSGVDPPPPPPQRHPSAKGSRPAPTVRTSSNSASSSTTPVPGPRTSSMSAPAASSFTQTAERYRREYPGSRTWSLTGSSSDTGRPLRNPLASIISNQPITRLDTLRRAWAASSVRLCADGGANRSYDALSPSEREIMLPTIIKGDLDSLRPDVRAYYSSRGVKIKKVADQDSTDSHKCIDEVESIESASGTTFSSLLFGGLSGRFDQTIATCSTMSKMQRKAATFIISEDSSAWCLPPGAHLIEIDQTTMGETCGLSPLSGPSHIRTEGLKWDFDWSSSMDGPVSSSNHVTDKDAFVHTSATIFWTVEIRPDSPAPRRSSGTVEEVTRGVRELGSRVGSVGREMGREVQRRISVQRDRPQREGWDSDGDRDDVRLNDYGGRTGGTHTLHDHEEDGYAQLD